MSGTVGRRTAFEIKVNDTVIHSKLSVGSFPDFDEVADIIDATSNGSEPTKVTKMQSSSCAIMEHEIVKKLPLTIPFSTQAVMVKFEMLS